jgi:hypothetical protein
MFPIRNIYQAVLFQRGNVFCLEPRVKTLSLHVTDLCHAHQPRMGLSRASAPIGQEARPATEGAHRRRLAESGRASRPEKKLAPLGSKYRIPAASITGPHKSPALRR